MLDSKGSVLFFLFFILNTQLFDQSEAVLVEEY